MTDKIFISSTCYDLLDVRSELEEHIRKLGFIPVLSDEITSDFAVDPSIDSIQNCLTNLRSSNVAIFILSRRYGGLLGKTGYPDISATHLEYQTAIEEEIPVYFFVRDRLHSDYCQWCDQGKPDRYQSRWILGENPTRLLKFYDEHNVLKKEKGANWVDVFKSSYDLKNVIERRLKTSCIESQFISLLDAGKLPEISLFCRMRSRDTWTLEFTNLTSVPAREIKVILYTPKGPNPLCTFPVITSERHREAEVKVSWFGDYKGEYGIQIQYSAVGFLMADVYYGDNSQSKPSKFSFKGKMLIDTKKQYLDKFTLPWRTE